jgi:hypothetical protein
MPRRLCALFLLIPLIAAAQAPSVSPADARAVRAVIEAQLDAFQHDDGERAFSYAAPGIRETFRTAENFMEMVRTQYAVVYRPSRVQFEDALIVQGEVVQPVRFTDALGQLWLAIYPMERAADGVWSINGCYLDRLRGQNI